MRPRMNATNMSPDLSLPVVVRRATKDDLPSIGLLGRSLAAAHHGFDQARFLPVNNRTQLDYASYLGERLKDRDVAIFVADCGGRVVGYTFTRLEGFDYMVLRGPAGVIHDLMVDEAYRRQGIGRLLLQAAVTFLKSQGAPRVVLSTAARNEVAQRLFSSMGFRPTMNEMTCELGEFPKRQVHTAA